MIRFQKFGFLGLLLLESLVPALTHAQTGRAPTGPSSFFGEVWRTSPLGCAGKLFCAPVADDVELFKPIRWSSDLYTSGLATNRIFRDAIIAHNSDVDHGVEDPVYPDDVGTGGRKGDGGQGNGNGQGNGGGQGNGEGQGNGNGQGNAGQGSQGNGGQGGQGNGNGQGNEGDDEDTGSTDPGLLPGGDDEDPFSGQSLPTQTTPEPATVVLLATGFAGLATAHWRRRKR